MSEEEKPTRSALKVQEGIAAPSVINPLAIKKLKKSRKPVRDVGEYLQPILEGNRTILSQAITLVESALPEHQEMAQKIIERCLPYTGKSMRIGITGVPGVGKSTFIEAFGKYLTGHGHKLAVLAIDPSSGRSKGSILGDKTRMEELSVDPNAFIRPSPSAGSLGGVARKTRETILLCEAAGFDIVFVETVGVGQSETAVYSMVDFFLLLMLSGAGDELQGIKRGIMEMADAILINKADGDNIRQAELARCEYQNALHLFPPKESGWVPVADTCSARTRAGIDRIWSVIARYRKETGANGYFEAKRQEQTRLTIYETINQQLRDEFYSDPGVIHLLARLEKEVLGRKISAYVAALQILESYHKQKRP